MIYTVFDIETNGLRFDCDNIWCLSFTNLRDVGNGVLEEIGRNTFTKKNDILGFLRKSDVLVGHNIITYDLAVLQDFGHDFYNKDLWDTLALSYTLYPQRAKHGLELWGETFGVPKPVIEDWENLTLSDYKHRCEEDVKINVELFKRQFKYLWKLYQGDLNSILDYKEYLNEKMLCMKEQEEEGCPVDEKSVEKHLEELSRLKQEKVDALVVAMPLNIKYKTKVKPKVMYKKDGTLSSHGKKWEALLESLDEDPNAEEVIVVDKTEPGNPNSVSQLKDWLFALGWEPAVFKTSVNVKGESKEVPQIYDNKELCQSIRILCKIEPALESLDMLTMINHRLGVFKSFKENTHKGYTVAGMRGFTNTLRLKHRKPVANLPKVGKFYGAEIRGLIVKPDEEHLLCGSDMSSLEDTTKQHYMYYFDPQYITEMRVPGFCPHIDIAVLAGMMSEDEAKEYKRLKKVKDKTSEEYAEFNRLDNIRTEAKPVNFGGVYGIGAPKLAKQLGCSVAEATKLHTIYWDRNKAVKQVEDAVNIRVVFKDYSVKDYTGRQLKSMSFRDQEEFMSEVQQMWLFNPVSKFYYSLRYVKDIFSTLNQGTGVYCFDMNVKEIRKQGIKIMLQYHDEHLAKLPTNGVEEHTNKLNLAIEEVNKQLQLNVPLGISMDYGDSYADCH